MKNRFIHPVFFWLKNPESAADKKELIEGLVRLSTIKTIREFHIGKPAFTKRTVIDSSYTVSWLLEFANDADQQAYQTDPVHLAFIEACAHLWSSVLVYNPVDA
jgi:hypothetical protein